MTTFTPSGLHIDADRAGHGKDCFRIPHPNLQMVIDNVHNRVTVAVRRKNTRKQGGDLISRRAFAYLLELVCETPRHESEPRDPHERTQKRIEAILMAHAAFQDWLKRNGLVVEFVRGSRRAIDTYVILRRLAPLSDSHPIT